MSRDALAKCSSSDEKTNFPSSFWNGMIFPLLKYKITGALWYQGESNAGAFQRYICQYREMMNDWRLKWKIPNIYFIATQLAGFENGDFTNIRAVQYLLTQQGTNHSMVTAIDLGHISDIHPTNKRGVAERMELVASEKIYKRDVISSGPYFSRITTERRDTDAQIRVDFLHAQGGLALKPSDNCTVCCRQTNDIFTVLTDVRLYNTELQILNDHVILRAPISRGETIALVRSHWTRFPQCVLINQRTRLPLVASYFAVPNK